MDKEKLYKLAERYQNKADTAYNAYQETGITRYDTARRNNEDLAEAIRAAAAASDEHNELVHLRGNMADPVSYTHLRNGAAGEELRRGDKSNAAGRPHG